jgi:hypothetical protein
MAGMLGYVQSQDPQYWAKKIETALSKSRESCKILENGAWRPQKLADGLPHTYRSDHGRETLERSIEIYHTLLAFC